VSIVRDGVKFFDVVLSASAIRFRVCCPTARHDLDEINSIPAEAAHSAAKLIERVGGDS
jgi:hypothetical protein